MVYGVNNGFPVNPWYFDRSTGHGVGTTADRQTRFDPLTNVVDHGATAAANGKEAIWNGIGMIPIAGPIVNVGRGLFNMAKGLFTGDLNGIREGAGQVGKGALFAIPGAGTYIAGAMTAKDLVDAGYHASMSSAQKSMYGSYENQAAMARQMMYGGMGYSLGLSQHW